MTAGTSGMYQTKSTHDWGLFFGGLLVILCGVAVIFWPGATLEILAIVAGCTFLVAGGFAFGRWIRTHKYVDGSGWTLANAICDVILGLMFLIHPIIAAGAMTFVIGCFVVAYGVFAIVSSISLMRIDSSWWVMLLNGILSLICGWLFIFSPGFFAIYLGVFLMMQGVTMSVYGISPSRDNGIY